MCLNASSETITEANFLASHLGLTADGGGVCFYRIDMTFLKRRL